MSEPDISLPRANFYFIFLLIRTSTWGLWSGFIGPLFVHLLVTVIYCYCFVFQVGLKGYLDQNDLEFLISLSPIPKYGGLQPVPPRLATRIFISACFLSQKEFQVKDTMQVDLCGFSNWIPPLSFTVPGTQQVSVNEKLLFYFTAAMGAPSVGALGCVCMCVWRPQVHTDVSLHCSSPSFLRASLTGPGAQGFRWTGWSPSPRNLPESGSGSCAWVQGIWTRLLVLTQWALNQLSHPLPLNFYFL